MLGESFLHNITVYSHATEHCLSEWCYQGIEIMNNGNNPYNSSSNLHISKITIAGNGSRSQTACIIRMHIHMELTGYSTTLILSDLLFYHTDVQPVFKIKVLDTVLSRVTLWIKNCMFLYNDYEANNRALQGPTVEIDIPYINAKVFFINCDFYENVNLFPLVSIQLEYSNAFHHSANCLYLSHIQFRQSTFIGNISPIIVNFSGDKKSKCLTHFSMIGPLIVQKNIALKGDVISIYYATVNIIGEATFSSNSEAKNIILFYYCNVMFHKNVYFINNGATFLSTVDNVITVQSDYAYITVMENSNIEFINNTYTNGVVQVIVEDYILHPFCAFQYHTVTTGNVYDLLKNYKIRFHGGYKKSRLDDDDDNLLLNYYTFHCQWLPNSTFYGYHPADINKQIIQTDDEQMYRHTRVCYCFMNNTYDCSLDLLGPVFPGQVLQVDLCVPHQSDSDKTFVLYIDTHNTNLPRSACKVAHQNQLINTISSSSKTYNFTIVSDSQNECELFLTAQPDLYKIYDAFYVQLLPCPVGFTLQNGVCDCDPILSTIINKCYIDYSAIRRPANSWIIVHTQKNNTKYFISNNCPMDYCLPYSSDVNLLYPGLQCQFNRSGMLCSQCQHPLSVVFASSRCIKCTNVHILITIIVIMAGIVLVVLLYVLNLTVTNGTINGIIFYANIVSINDSVFLVNDNVFKPLRVFISFANLDLGIETCFYNGMDSYAKMWLQLLFPSYLLTIATSIIIASRYSTRILRLTYTRSLPVLATLFLLSYTGILRTVLTVLFSYSTITHLPNGHQQLVWSIDASVPLFGLKFTILFITCLVLFLVLIPFNVVLLFSRYLMHFRLINRSKPLLDAFQGSYKNKCYYWVAVHLTLRSLFFTFYVFSMKLNLICSTMLLIMFAVYSGYVRPNKIKPVNAQEVLLLINLTIMYAVSFQSNVFFIVANTMISLAFVQFAIIVLYHFLTYTCHCDVVCMERTVREKVMKFCKKKSSNRVSNNIALLNIPECTYNYTEYRDGLVSDDFR